MFSTPHVAADVFRLNSLPENETKKLDVSASFFEIYSGKVRACACTHTGSSFDPRKLSLLTSSPTIFPHLLLISTHPVPIQVYDLLNEKRKLRILEDAKQQVQVQSLASFPGHVGGEKVLSSHVAWEQG